MEKYEKEILRKLHYDYETGDIYWKFVDETTPSDKTFNKRFAGKIAGSIKTSRNKEGYREIHISGKMVKAHRVAWFLYYGKWPEGEIDHINHKRDDNRIENLREVCRFKQNRNASRRKDNKSGITGVYFIERDSKWVACIQQDGKRINKYFKNKQDAVKTREAMQSSMDFSETHGKEIPSD